RTNAIKSVPSPTTRRSLSGSLVDDNGDGENGNKDALVQGRSSSCNNIKKEDGLSLIAPPRDRTSERGRPATAMVTSP
ncbi:hypothetical protein HDU76_010777, partial [Blyttiomyces sp. JEL0837]